MKAIMKKDKTVAFRADTETREKLTALHGTMGAGAEQAIEVYLALRDRTLADLKGRFGRGEISYLVDMMNGTLLEPRWAVIPEVLVHSVEDADKYDGLAEKWDIDREVLEAKIRNLSASECLFLQEEIRRFWNQDGEFDEFVAGMV